MPGIRGWDEVESEVYRPGRWLGLLVGTFFLLSGVIAFFTIGGAVPPGLPFWIAKACTGVFAFLGGAVTTSVLGGLLWPAHVRHAAPDVLPNVPKEPVVREGSILYGRPTHELCEDAQGWELRPAGRLLHNDKVFVSGFGIVFLSSFAGVMTWVLHSQAKIGGWPISAVLAIFATAVCGGIPIVLLGMGLRAGYRQLSRLIIPCNGSDLELDCPDEHNLNDALKWMFVGDTKRQRRSIPRDLVVAVQLCPWKFTVDRSRVSYSWALQGLLVLASSEEAVYHRLPLLLTADFVGAARLMEQLARLLKVPYLYCADAEGWKAEGLRAKDRPPLRMAGSQS